MVNGGTHAGLAICRCTISASGSGGAFTGFTVTGSDGLTVSSITSGAFINYTFTDTSLYPNGGYTIIATPSGEIANFQMPLVAARTTSGFAISGSPQATTVAVDVLVIGPRND